MHVCVFRMHVCVFVYVSVYMGICLCGKGSFLNCGDSVCVYECVCAFVCLFCSN